MVMSRSLHIEKFSQAIVRLEEALAEEKNDITRDAALLRFQLVFELAWKSIQETVREHGLEDCYSPKQCIKEAFKQEWIPYDEKWLQMIDDRNQITHTYKEETAEQVYSHLATYISLFKNLEKTLT